MSGVYRYCPSLSRSTSKDLVENMQCLKFFGPYKIVERIGSLAYKLQLPPESAIHPVFHVSQLKQALVRFNEVQPSGPVLMDMFEWVTKPAETLGFGKFWWHGRVCLNMKLLGRSLRILRCSFLHFTLRTRWI